MSGHRTKLQRTTDHEHQRDHQSSQPLGLQGLRLGRYFLLRSRLFLCGRWPRIRGRDRFGVSHEAYRMALVRLSDRRKHDGRDRSNRTTDQRASSTGVRPLPDRRAVRDARRATPKDLGRPDQVLQHRIDPSLGVD